MVCASTCPTSALALDGQATMTLASLVVPDNEPICDVLNTAALGDLAQLHRSDADIGRVSGRDVAIAVERPLVQSASCRIGQSLPTSLSHNRL